MRSGLLKGDRCWEGRERVREGCRQGRSLKCKEASWGRLSLAQGNEMSDVNE